MVEKSVPEISIGLPVYNGEPYLEQTIKTILSQSFNDFELIISDNASTDGTSEICKSYSERDSRIIYIKNEKNLGAAMNYRNVFHFSKGKYFKWAAHDDVLRPDYLAVCHKILTDNPKVILAHTLTQSIDEEGQPIKNWSHQYLLESSEPKKRFVAVLYLETNIFYIFGLIRRSALMQTELLGNFPYHDLVLLSKLSLLGPFKIANEVLFLDRDHSERFTKKYNHVHESAVWFSPHLNQKLIFPQWRLLYEYTKIVKNHQQSTLSKIPYAINILKHFIVRGPHLLSDLLIAFELRVPFFGPLLARFIRKIKGMLLS